MALKLTKEIPFSVSVLKTRVQLAVSFSHIVRYDYPSRWPDIAEKIRQYLTSNQHEAWMGTLICLYQLVKNFE